MISGFNPFCEFLCFKVLLLVIVIMIDGTSEKRNSDKLAFKLHSSRLMNGSNGTKPPVRQTRQVM